MPHLEIEIADEDFPNIADVDLKLIELAKRYDGKIITNDYNLNKVASLQGIEILNVNQSHRSIFIIHESLAEEGT